MEVIKIKLLQDYDVAGGEVAYREDTFVRCENIKASFIFLAHLFVSLR